MPKRIADVFFQKIMSLASSLFEEALVSVRLVSVDHYMATPVPDLDPTFSVTRSHVAKKVPVLRIFGPTAAGQKTCLHVHGVFPYIFVPAPADVPGDFASKLAASLDRALDISLGAQNGRDKTPQHHVYKVQEVSGIPFYGYHPREHRFYRIFFYNPVLAKRAADILEKGGVMGLRLQPHESHVPFVLQFMMDHNLQGMNFLHLAHARFRRPEKPKSQGAGGRDRSAAYNRKDTSSSLRRFDVGDLPESLLLDPSVSRVSTSELEIDAVAADILNHHDSASASGMNPGLLAIWEDERLRRRLRGLIGEPLTPPSSPPRPEVQETESERLWRSKFLERLEEIKSDSEKFVTETKESQLSDPNATCNLLGSEGGESQSKPKVYPEETPRRSRLAKATQVEFHMPSLSRRSPDITQDSRGSEVEEDKSTPDDTIVDEDLVLSQSMSWPPSQDKAAIEPAPLDFDDDEMELAMLLTDLEAGRCKRRESQQMPMKQDHAESADLYDNPVPSTSKGRPISPAANPNTSIRPPSASEKNREEDEETLEMSQIIWETGDDEILNVVAKDRKSEDEEIWGNETFWENIDVDNQLKE